MPHALRLLTLATLLAAGCSPAAESPPVVAEVAPPADSPPVADTDAKLAWLREAVATKNAAGAVPYLRDAEPVIRRGAVLAVAAEAEVAPEVLFASLHDSDAEVQSLATSALRARGLSVNQVSLARQFSDPDPRERLSLLNDLRGGVVGDPAPWLARMAEDASPAVRLGAVRVATELRVKAPWIVAVARADADPQVRSAAAYYLQETGGFGETPARE